MPSDEPSLAIASGLAVHRLLQMLPGIAEGEREAAARRYLERVGGDVAAGRARHARCAR